MTAPQEQSGHNNDGREVVRTEGIAPEPSMLSHPLGTVEP